MAEAKEALEVLSAERSAQALAEVRQEGRREGRLVERRESVALVARTLGVAVDEHDAELESAPFEELEAILRHLVEHRVWPA